MTLHQELIDQGLSVATAESLTAGLLSSSLASQAGASKFFLGGVVAYQDQVKIHQLKVDSDLIAANTAVDGLVAMQMASGVRSKLAIDCSIDVGNVIGISTTGVAGPEPVGGLAVGLVFLGVASVRGVRSVELMLSGSRAEIQSAAVSAALAALEDEIKLLRG